jgi:hypothetical protein
VLPNVATTRRPPATAESVGEALTLATRLADAVVWRFVGRPSSF